MNSIDGDGDTPLICSVKRGQASVAKLLLKSGANVVIRNKEKKTALDYAIQQNQKDIIKKIQRVTPKRTEEIELQEKLFLKSNHLEKR